MFTAILVNLILCQQLGRCMPPAVFETRTRMVAEQAYVPLNPPVATHMRFGGVPYRIN